MLERSNIYSSMYWVYEYIILVRASICEFHQQALVIDFGECTASLLKKKLFNKQMNLFNIPPKAKKKCSKTKQKMI